MKIAVIAANGRSGVVFIEQALKAGHQVRAGVYGPHNFPANPNLEVVDCDATLLQSVKTLVKSCDAVVSLIGHTKSTPKDVQTNAIQNVVLAIQDTEIRLVSLTGTGVRFPDDKPSLIDRILNISINLIDPDRVADGINHAEVLNNSSINWTLIRVLKLSNGNNGEFNLTGGGPAKLLTSRSEVAKAILQVLQSKDYLKKAPVISS